MAIEDTNIFKETFRINQDGAKPVSYQWQAEISAGKESFNAFRVVEIDIVRDYPRNFTDVIMIKMLVPDGDYQRVILANKSSTDVVLYKYPYKEDGRTVDTTKRIETQRFRAVIKEEPSANIQGASPNNLTTDAANLNGFKELSVQLMDMNAHLLSKSTVGIILHDETPANAIRVLLGVESLKINSPGSEAVRGVDIAEPVSNNERSKHIVIPQDLLLVDVPLYIQNFCDGVYSTGLGYYLQKGMWYVYPIADTNRFSSAPRSLTVLNIPPNKMPHAERTYRQTPNQLIVLSTGGMRHYDNSEAVQMNDGNGARFTDASKGLEEEFGEFRNEEYFIKRGDNNSEFFSYARPDGVNRAAMSARAFTSNPFAVYSKIALRECTFIDFVWQNSNDSLIFPGMPAKFMYENNGVVEEVLGVVYKAHHFITGTNGSMVDNPHTTISTVTLLVKKKV